MVNNKTHQENKKRLFAWLKQITLLKAATPSRGTNYFGRNRVQTKKGAKHVVNPPGTKMNREFLAHAATLRGRVSMAGD